MGEQVRVWNGCAVPDGLLYDVELHVWVRLEGTEAVLGMTDVAQTQGGAVVQVTWKREGRTLARGRPAAVIESAKWVGPFPTPLSGVITALNREGYERDVRIGNRDPYGQGWLVRLRPTRLEQEVGRLLDAPAAFEAYRAYLEANDVRCYRCEQ